MCVFFVYYTQYTIALNQGGAVIKSGKWKIKLHQYNVFMYLDNRGWLVNNLPIFDIITLVISMIFRDWWNIITHRLSSSLAANADTYLP